MNYIVLDFEFNQSYDFNDGESYGVDFRCQFEIIQIGAVKLNSDFKIIDKFSVLIKPQIYQKIHPIVGKLTGLNTKMLSGETYFPEAYASFVDFIGEEKNMFCIWGPYDVKALYKNIFYYNLSYSKLNPVFVNVQNLASNFLKYPSGMSIGLKNAIEAFNLIIDKPFHNALNDAIYTAKILEKLKNQNLPIAKLDIDQLQDKPKYKGKINTKLLYSKIELELGRKLDRREKRLFINAYLSGRNKEFDI